MDAAPPEWTPPIVYAAFHLTLQRTAESFVYPEPFGRSIPSEYAAHYRRAFTELPVFDPNKPAFRWDGDPLAVNVLGHGLMGSELYLHARQCHFGWLGSTAFTAVASAVWEYGFEANGVRPSAQDLVYTPLVGGLVLGEARFLLYQVASRFESRGARDVLRAVADPFGELGRGALDSPC